jgi:hypothetical protein
MNFVVVLAIALIVMVIIIGIFATRSSEGNKNLQGCEGRNGVCVESYDGSDGTTFSSGCPPENARAVQTSTGNIEPESVSSIPVIGAKCYDSNGDVSAAYTCCLRQTDN